MDFCIVFILFWLYAILGWFLETTFVALKSKRYINRGFFLGPYCPIYGFGAILLLPLKSYQNDPLVVFILSVVICSIVEYITSYLMELVFKVRWWDYSNRTLNINGRICLFNSICFGFLGMFLVCYLNPYFVSLLYNLNDILIKIIAFSLLIITLVDFLLTYSIMFDIRKTIVNLKDKTLTNLFQSNTDGTEEISKMIRTILKEKTLIHKHLSKSYNNLKVYKSNFFEKTEKLKKHKKIEKEENFMILTSFISLIIGLILGLVFDNIGLLVSICFVLNLVIFHIKEKFFEDE